jgi:hypothetical protein
VSLRKLLHTTTFRLAAVYVAGFAASVAGLGVITYVITASALERRLDARMAIEMKALQADDRGGGLPRLIATVQARQALHSNGAFEYAVVEPCISRISQALPRQVGAARRAFRHGRRSE